MIYTIIFLFTVNYLVLRRMWLRQTEMLSGHRWLLTKVNKIDVDMTIIVGRMTQTAEEGSYELNRGLITTAEMIDSVVFWANRGLTNEQIAGKLCEAEADVYRMYSSVLQRYSPHAHKNSSETARFSPADNPDIEE